MCGRSLWPSTTDRTCCPESSPPRSRPAASWAVSSTEATPGPAPSPSDCALQQPRSLPGGPHSLPFGARTRLPPRRSYPAHSHRLGRMPVRRHRRIHLRRPHQRGIRLADPVDQRPALRQHRPRQHRKLPRRESEFDLIGRRPPGIAPTLRHPASVVRRHQAADTSAARRRLQRSPFDRQFTFTERWMSSSRPCTAGCCAVTIP